MAKKYLAGVACAALGLVLASCGGSVTSDINILPKDTQENVARVLWQKSYDESKMPAEVVQKLYSPKNLPDARGSRTQAFLDDLIANPDSCSPDYSERHKALRGFSGSLSGQQAYAIDLMLGPTSSRGYPPYDVTHTWYPDHVNIVFDADAPVPAERRVVQMVPIVKTGQQGWFAMGLQYSEGAVYLRNAQGENVGRGFLESTGYADGNAQMLKLAGIPATPAMLGLLERRKLGEAQAKQCGEMLLANAAQLEQEMGQCKGL